ncbi:MAG: bifunctional 4-hydroxy-2-oxoglutarate aldolase/2-dehydro-3-deoxy-phosphogluconate aldolase [Rhodobacteraceae bacterium]|nr:bifunctional 4-hydroxy-2-oxoglutarate aldolase/2-dehydro-3-deoxy-phosphogluconate aldolase [Paracoccaceae bacterium]
MTAAQASRKIRAICELAPIVPVIVVKNVDHAVPLAKALVAGGLPVLEVTLRTPEALQAITAMSEVDGSYVGAGTVLTPDEVKAAQSAGATFAVSPGATDTLLDACEAVGLPMLPGAATASEAMRLYERGYDMLKFFPAEASGGAPALRALAAPLPKIFFCPTGGVGPANAETYLTLPNVACAGGSWVAPADLMEAGQWGKITELASDAAALPRG